MLKILIKDNIDQKLMNTLNHLQDDHSEVKEGIYDLYDSLSLNGSCSSYDKSRIYYVAYTLAIENIDFKIY